MNIQEISLRDVIFSGRHGATAQEKEINQTFKVTLSIRFDVGRALETDMLVDTIDYYRVVALVRKHIEDRDVSHTLLENLVEAIVDDIAQSFLCLSIDLSIHKPNVPFEPGIKTGRHYFSHRLPGAPSFEEIHTALTIAGIVSTPFLTEEERIFLLEKARTAPFVRQPEMTESGIVREDLASFTIKDEGSPFFSIADRCGQYLGELMRATEQASGAFLVKPDVALQKYEKGSFGITPHRDEKKYGMCICVIPLVGKGTLAVCEDRAGTHPLVVDTTPGNLVLLRAPGYANMHVRPMHTLTDITEERIVLGVRFPLHT